MGSMEIQNIVLIIFALVIGIAIGYALKKGKVTKQQLETLKKFLKRVVAPLAKNTHVEPLVKIAITVLEFWTGQITRERAKAELLSAIEEARQKLKAKLTVELEEEFEKCVKEIEKVVG